MALSSENSGVPHLPAEDLIVPDQRLLVSEQLGSLQAGCPDRGQPYAETLQSLYNEIPSAEWLFPEGLGPAATEGARRLVIGSIDTVRAHMTADEQTAGSLQLRSGWELPYDFWGTDPLKRLESLRLAYWMVGQLRDNPDIAAVQVMSGHGYA